jgi:hypothetical protein
MQPHRHIDPETNSLPLDSGHAPGNVQKQTPKTQTISSLYFHPHALYLSAIDKSESRNIIPSFGTPHITKLQLVATILRPKEKRLQDQLPSEISCDCLYLSCGL